MSLHLVYMIINKSESDFIAHYSFFLRRWTTGSHDEDASIDWQEFQDLEPVTIKEIYYISKTSLLCGSKGTLWMPMLHTVTIIRWLLKSNISSVKTSTMCIYPEIVSISNLSSTGHQPLSYYDLRGFQGREKNLKENREIERFRKWIPELWF